MRSLRFISSALVVIATVSLARPSALAQSRTEIAINDTMVMPESITSSADGAVFFGSTAKGNIYRAAPGAAQADLWIDASSAGLSNVLGVFADDRSHTLWVCSNATGGRAGAPTAGETALRAFDLASRASKGAWPFPGGGFCNDIAIGDDGTAYATDTTGRRVLRLKPGAAALDVWLDDQQLNGLDGIALLGRAIYVNCFYTGDLFRAVIQPTGGAGPLTKIETSLPFTRPDGLRSAGSDRMLQAEGQGRLTELTIRGDRADVRVLREGATGATAVTRVGDIAFVLVERVRAVAVPYAGH